MLFRQQPGDWQKEKEKKPKIARPQLGEVYEGAFIHKPTFLYTLVWIGDQCFPFGVIQIYMSKPCFTGKCFATSRISLEIPGAFPSPSLSISISHLRAIDGATIFPSRFACRSRFSTQVFHSSLNRGRTSGSSSVIIREGCSLISFVTLPRKANASAGWNFSFCIVAFAREGLLFFPEERVVCLNEKYGK